MWYVFAGCHRERKKPFREKRIHKEVGFNVDTVENPQIAGKIYSAGNFYFVITDGLQHVEIMTSSISSSWIKSLLVIFLKQNQKTVLNWKTTTDPRQWSENCKRNLLDCLWKAVVRIEKKSPSERSKIFHFSFIWDISSIKSFFFNYIGKQGFLKTIKKTYKNETWQ